MINNKGEYIMNILLEQVDKSKFYKTIDNCRDSGVPLETKTLEGVWVNKQTGEIVGSIAGFGQEKKYFIVGE